MIGWLRGTLLERLATGEVLVGVGGVGYRVSVPANLVSSLSSVGTAVELHVHTHVREDAIVLYGFSSLAERRVFEALIGAHGVGPSLALAVLSVLGPEELLRAVQAADVDALCSVPGVGRKTAQRLLLELAPSFADGQMPGAVGTVPEAGGSSGHSDIRAALVELGYGPDEVRGAMASLPSEGSVEELLKGALRELASSR
ncbi:MAG: Holliday junction branch migration protein RuvA [Acidimicrobiales bacterium]|jgi:Holliday junction DNA helicase RuvA|nr:Holliday junction branch migration protein RuvA [Actinomycetota bacterium]